MAALQIDRYVVERLIGQGAMGKVYLASDPKLGRQVAIKVLPREAQCALPCILLGGNSKL